MHLSVCYGIVQFVFVPLSIPWLVKCADGAQEVEDGLHRQTPAGDEKGEGEVCSPDSWPKIRAGQPEGTTTDLRDFQPEERRGVYVYSFAFFHTCVVWSDVD